MLSFWQHALPCASRAHVRRFVGAGPAILHGISGLLLPDLPPDPNQLPPPSENDPLMSEYEQPPDADVAEEAGPGSLEEANKEAQGEDYNTSANPAQPTATTQQGRTGPAAVAAAAGGARGMGTGPVVPGGVNGAASSSSSSRAGMGSMGAAGAATGSRQTVGGVPGAAAPAAGAGPAGTGVKGSASTDPVTTERGVSANGVGMGAPARRSSSALLPDSDVDVSAATGEEMAGSLGRRRLLLPHGMLAAGQPTRNLLAAGLQTAPLVLGGRGLLAGMQRPASRAATATPAATAAAAAGVTGATPSGALSSTVNVGAVGELQSFVNGIASNRTLTALKLSGGTTVPKGYVNRYGAFSGATAKGGCLNCKSWGREQPQ